MQMKHFWLHVEFMKRTMFNMLTMNNKLNEITIVFLTKSAIFLLFVSNNIVYKSKKLY